MTNITENISYNQMKIIVSKLKLDKKLPIDIVSISSQADQASFQRFANLICNTRSSFRLGIIFENQKHWFALDITCTKDEMLVVVLDSANSDLALRKTFTVAVNLLQLKKELTIFHITSLNKYGIQKDNKSCGIFALELLQWSLAQQDLHATLEQLSREVQPTLYRQKVEQAFSAFPQMKSYVDKVLPYYQWIDYSQLTAPEFCPIFLNSQSQLPNSLKHFQPQLKDWLVFIDGKMRNFRNLYLNYKYSCFIDGLPVKSEKEFIINHVETEFAKPIDELISALRDNSLSTIKFLIEQKLLSIPKGQINFLLSYLPSDSEHYAEITTLLNHAAQNFISLIHFSLFPAADKVEQDMPCFIQNKK